MKRVVPDSHSEPDVTPVGMTGDAVACSASGDAGFAHAASDRPCRSSDDSLSPRTRAGLVGLARLLGRLAAREVARGNGGGPDE